MNKSETLAGFKLNLGRFLEKVPDTPPTKGYVAVNNNYLSDWSQYNYVDGASDRRDGEGARCRIWM